jgi:hypothetical protein
MIDSIKPRVHDPVKDTLLPLVQGATRARFAVAYLTAKGATTMEPVIQAVEATRYGFGIVSVEWPTDIDELVRLAHRLPGKLFIHLGTWPKSGKKDIGKLHCKIIYIDADSDARIQVGSHNWTDSALNGSNIELSARVTLPPSDPFAREVSDFIDTVRVLSEPFDPAKRNFYREIQNRMFEPAPEHAVELESGFEGDLITVVHAEPVPPTGSPTLDRVYLELDSAHDSMFPKNRTVHLYLHGGSEGSSPPVLYIGVVTNQNNTEFHTLNPDKFREYTECTSMIINWAAPKLEKMETPLSDARRPSAQAVLRLQDRPSTVGFLYHVGRNRPRTSYEIQFESIVKRLGSQELTALAPLLQVQELQTPKAVFVVSSPRLDRRSTPESLLSEAGETARITDAEQQSETGVVKAIIPDPIDVGPVFETRFYQRITSRDADRSEQH